MSGFKLNDAIGIVRTLATIGNDNESRPLAGRKLKERLGETPMMERICNQISELAKAISKDSGWLALAYRF